MSSASQPREWAMNGNGGNTNPNSDQNVNMLPATAWMLSCPPVMMNAATLLRISTLLWIVTWFCTQFRRSTILLYRDEALPRRIGVEIRTTSAQCTSPSYTGVSWSSGSRSVMAHGQVQAWEALE